MKKEKAISLYERHFSTTEIAELFEVSPSTIARKLKKAGIKLRDKHESHRLKNKRLGDSRDAARFWSKVLPENDNGCREFSGYRTPLGYGRLRFRRKKHLAHRVAWILTHGEIPDGEGYHGTCVCHTCDNPACCNPDHLFLGSHQENIEDCVKKGRQGRSYAPGLKGEKSPACKLSDNQVKQIRMRRDAGETVTSLAAAFNVHHSHISRLCRGLVRANQ